MIGYPWLGLAQSWSGAADQNLKLKKKRWWIWLLCALRVRSVCIVRVHHCKENGSRWQPAPLLCLDLAITSVDDALMTRTCRLWPGRNPAPLTTQPQLWQYHKRQWFELTSLEAQIGAKMRQFLGGWNRAERRRFWAKKNLPTRNLPIHFVKTCWRPAIPHGNATPAFNHAA